MRGLCSPGEGWHGAACKPARCRTGGISDIAAPHLCARCANRVTSEKMTTDMPRADFSRRAVPDFPWPAGGPPWVASQAPECRRGGGPAESLRRPATPRQHQQTSAARAAHMHLPLPTAPFQAAWQSAAPDFQLLSLHEASDGFYLSSNHIDDVSIEKCSTASWLISLRAINIITYKYLIQNSFIEQKCVWVAAQHQF